MNEPQSLEQQREAQSAAHDLRHRIAIGLDIQRFMGTHGGRAFEQLAKSQIDEALTEMAEGDPFDGKAMAALQLTVRSRQLALSWLNELVVEGQQAEIKFVEGEG